MSNEEILWRPRVASRIREEITCPKYKAYDAKLSLISVFLPQTSWLDAINVHFNQRTLIFTKPCLAR